jgi:pimeloyl-ACP methyl ester carboxylesterase
MSVSRFANANGLKLHYLDYGNGDAPALVCIHGLTGNAHNFDAVAPHLRHAYRVVSLDVRGRGDSQWGPPENYTYSQYASDLASFLDALDIRRVSLLGTSMGGIISMIYAASHSQRIERVVLNDIGPEFDLAGVERILDSVSEAPREFRDLDEVAAYYRAAYPPLADAPVQSLLGFCRWAVREGENGRQVWKTDPAVRRVRPTGPSSVLPDLWAMYRRITAPVLVIRGAESDLLSPATTQRMRAAHAKTRVVEVPGAGHAPFLTEPEALAALKEFFAC